MNGLIVSTPSFSFQVILLQNFNLPAVNKKIEFRRMDGCIHVSKMYLYTPVYKRVVYIK